MYQVKFFNINHNNIVTCKNYGIRLWAVGYEKKKILSIDVNFTDLKTQISCMYIVLYNNNAYFVQKVVIY